MSSEENKKSVITRFPPSPTGFLHIGRARTALFNYLFARQNNGKLIFRLEDTDKARSKPEFEQNFYDCLNWLGIKWDNERVVKQSEKTEVYQKYVHKMVEEKTAYLSKEENGNEVVRFKNPNKKVTFTDLIRGDITFDTTELEDFIIARNINEPLYHLTAVVDDFEGGITHIIRGDDGISNTPRQILIQEAIGAPKPIYAHLPLILAADRSKLSGRHGAVSVTEYKEQGYLPEALINYLALLGWNPGTEQEIFSMDELIKAFDLTKVNKAGAVFNPEKLKWFNKQYISKMSLDEFKKVAAPFANNVPEKIWPLLKERTTLLSELKDLSEFDFLSKKPEFAKEKLNWKEKPANKNLLEETKKIIETVSDFTKENIKTALWPLAEKEGRGEVLWPLRIALSGKDKSPDPFILCELLGKEESISRINYAISVL
jgi:glutamyl-tRNA synthetase